HPAALGNPDPIRALTPIPWMPGGVGGLAWLVSLALVPYFRRRYPDLLVSWSRLIGGRVDDPLVGRDLLGGLLLGCAAVLINLAVSAAPAFVASGGETPMPFAATALAGLMGAVGVAGDTLIDTIMNTVFCVAIVLLGALVLRRKALGIGALWVLVVAFNAGRENAILEVPAAALTAGLLVVALLRFGVVGVAASNLANLLLYAPLTLDLSAWYAAYGLFFVLLVAAFAVWGFWAARGGGALISEAALDG
ncbi:MAG: hypothetical protein ACHQM4_12100, partial [Thermoanaerobaculia bacterium]